MEYRLLLVKVRLMWLRCELIVGIGKKKKKDLLDERWLMKIKTSNAHAMY